MQGTTDMSWTRTCACCWLDACSLLSCRSVILRETGAGSWKERVYEERGSGSVQSI